MVTVGQVLYLVPVLVIMFVTFVQVYNCVSQIMKKKQLTAVMIKIPKEMGRGSVNMLLIFLVVAPCAGSES